MKDARTVNAERVVRAREARAGIAMISPAVLVLLLVAAWPIAAAVVLSLHREIVVFHEHRFVGLDNWSFLLGDARFWAALGHTAYFTVVAVSIELVLGLVFALLLHAPGRGAPRGRGLLRASVLVPWAIPTVVSAKLWAWLYDPAHGLVTHVLGLSDVNLLGVPVLAMHAAIVVDVWKTTPFVALILLAGLQAIPEDLSRAARIDGASPARAFFAITLPLLWPTIAIAGMLRALDAVRVFDAIFVLTDGGPANTTETLSIYAYKTMMRLGDFGYGSTLSVATFVVALLVAMVWLALSRRANR